MSKQPKPRYPMDDIAWEACIYRIIDGINGEEENEEACLAIEQIRNERTALIERLEKKPK